MFADIDPRQLSEGFAIARLALDVTERRTGASWPVPAVVRRSGLSASFTADVDPYALAAGERLPNGLWDVNVEFGVLGVQQRRHLTLVAERQPGDVLPEPTQVGRAPRLAAYFTRQTRALCLDIGLIGHKKLRLDPASKVPTTESAAPPPPTLTPAAPRPVVQGARPGGG